MRGAINKAVQLNGEIPIRGFRNSSTTQPTLKSITGRLPKKSGMTWAAGRTCWFQLWERVAR